MSPIQSLSVVIPSYNEQKAIPKMAQLLEQTHQLFQTAHPQAKMEVIVVDDGSSDHSAKELDKLNTSLFKIHKHKKNQGYGAAIKSGIQRAESDYIAFLDMDVTYNPKDILRLLVSVNEQKHVMAVGNRFTQSSKMPMLRQLGNRVYIFTLSLLSKFRIQDPCSGLRVFKAQSFKDIYKGFPDDLSFALAMTSYCIANKLSFIEVPIHYSQRMGESKLNEVKDGLMFFVTIFKAFNKKYN